MNRNIWNLRMLLTALAVADAGGTLDGEQLQHAVEAMHEDVDALEAQLAASAAEPGMLLLPLLTVDELALEAAARRRRPSLTLVAGGAA